MIGSTSQSLRLKIEVDADTGTKTITRLNASLKEVGGPHLDKSNRSLMMLAQSIDSVGRVAQRVTAIGIKTMTASFIGLGLALVAVSREFIKVNENFAQLDITVGSALKNIAAARDITRELASITARSPIPFQFLAKSVQSFAVIPQTSQKLLEQVVSGTLSDKNGFLRRAVGLVEAMATFRPDQGAEGAVFAIREAMGGQLRSLIRRFDIPSRLLSAASGQSLQELIADPNKMIESMMKVFTDIISPQAIQAFARQPTVLFENFIEQLVELPALSIGRSGAYQKILVQLEKFFNEINMFVEDEFESTFSGRISDTITRVFFESGQKLNQALNSVASYFGIDTNQNRAAIFFEVIAKGVEGLFALVPKTIDFFMEMSGGIKATFEIFYTAAKTVVNIFKQLTDVFGNFGAVAALVLGYAALPKAGSLIAGGISGAAGMFGRATGIAPHLRSTRSLIDEYHPNGIIYNYASPTKFQSRVNGRFGAPVSRSAARSAGLAAAGAGGLGAAVIGSLGSAAVIAGVSYAIYKLIDVYNDNKEFIERNTQALRALRESQGILSRNFLLATGGGTPSETSLQASEADTAAKVKRLKSIGVLDKSLIDIVSYEPEGYFKELFTGGAEGNRYSASAAISSLQRNNALMEFIPDDALEMLYQNIGKSKKEVEEAMAEFSDIFDFGTIITEDLVRNRLNKQEVEEALNAKLAGLDDSVAEYFRRIKEGTATGTFVDINTFLEQESGIANFRSTAQLRKGVTNNVLFLETFDSVLALKQQLDPLAEFFVKSQALDREIGNFNSSIQKVVNTNLEAAGISSSELPNTLQEYYSKLLDQFDDNSEIAKKIGSGIFAELEKRVKTPEFQKLSKTDQKTTLDALEEFRQKGFEGLDTLRKLIENLIIIPEEALNFTKIPQALQSLSQFSQSFDLNDQQFSSLGRLLGGLPGGDALASVVDRLRLKPGEQRSDAASLEAQKALADAMLEWLSNTLLNAAIEGFSDQQSREDIQNIFKGYATATGFTGADADLRAKQIRAGQQLDLILNPYSVAPVNVGDRGRSVLEASFASRTNPVTAKDRELQITRQLADVSELLTRSEVKRNDALYERLEGVQMELELEREQLAFANTFEGGKKGFVDSIRQQIMTIQEMGETLGQNLSNSLGNAFGDFVIGAQSASDAFRNFTISVLQDAAKTMASQSVVTLLGGLFGNWFGGGAFKGANIATPLPASTAYDGILTASGGAIMGGSGYRDDVPLLAMGGEYMMKKSAVNYWGMNVMDSMNNFDRMPKYAAGGLVIPQSNGNGGTMRMSSSKGDAPKVELHIHVDAGGNVGAKTRSGDGGESGKLAEALGDHFQPIIQDEIVKMSGPGQFFDQWHRAQHGGR